MSCDQCCISVLIASCDSAVLKFRSVTSLVSDFNCALLCLTGIPSKTFTAIIMQKDNSTSTDPQISTRICLDVGHAYEPRRWAPNRAVEQKWRMWVRGAAGADISAFVDKVFFQLRPGIQHPSSGIVVLEPPYQIEKPGSMPPEIHIYIYLKCTTKPEWFQLKYGTITNSTQSSTDSQCIYYDVRNPSEQLRMALMKSKPSKLHSDSVLDIEPNSGEDYHQSHQRAAKRKRYEFDEPIETKPLYQKNKRTTLLKKCLISEHSKLIIKNRLRPGMSSVLREKRFEYE